MSNHILIAGDLASELDLYKIATERGYRLVSNPPDRLLALEREQSILEEFLI